LIIPPPAVNTGGALVVQQLIVDREAPFGGCSPSRGGVVYVTDDRVRLRTTASPLTCATLRL
jgi:hypothetical protein